MEDVFVKFIVLAALLVFPAWRIFGKAGLDPTFAVVVFIPFVGPMVAMAILAFSDWPSNRDAGDPERGGI